MAFFSLFAFRGRRRKPVPPPQAPGASARRSGSDSSRGQDHTGVDAADRAHAVQQRDREVHHSVATLGASAVLGGSFGTSALWAAAAASPSHPPAHSHGSASCRAQAASTPEGAVRGSGAAGPGSAACATPSSDSDMSNP